MKHFEEFNFIELNLFFSPDIVFDNQDLEMNQFVSFLHYTKFLLLVLALCRYYSWLQSNMNRLYQYHLQLYQQGILLTLHMSIQYLLIHY